MENGRKKYSARVEEVHSGDDFIVLVDLGIDGLYKRTRVRLHGVDAPNAYKAKPETEAGQVRDEVKRLVSGKCIIEVVSEGKGGWIVIMYVQNGPEMDTTSLNDYLAGRGYVYKSQNITQE
jgi:hypothetical protein